MAIVQSAAAFGWNAAPLPNWRALPAVTARAPGHSALCTLMPGTTLALVRVEQDTMLPHGTPGTEMLSATGIRPGTYDTLLALPSTLMPAARVRVLELDSATRATLASNGINADRPFVFIRAAPYRADCKTIRWTDTIPFVVRGEVGYVRATLASREQWINGVPVLVIPDAWYYPYPRRRGLAFRASPDATLAPAEAMFGFNAAIQMPRPQSAESRIQQDSVKRTRALAWARANAAAAELEPMRMLIRRAVLEPDWEVASRVPSRLRGTYRVDMEVEDSRATWFFRTHDRPGYSWNGADSLTTAALVASPFVFGYRLVGLAAASADSLVTAFPRGPNRLPLVWLASTDRPTLSGNGARLSLSGFLEFYLGVTPQLIWEDLEAFVPPMNTTDSVMMARMNRSIPREQRQPQLPITLELDGRGGVRGDATVTARGRAIRVTLERIDTISIRRPY